MSISHYNLVNEVNPITAQQKKMNEQITRSVYWTEPGLKITRLRLVTDSGFPMYDVSYCTGVVNGEPVDVELPFYQLPKRGKNKAIVQYAIQDKVYAKGLGILHPLVQSVLR